MAFDIVDIVLASAVLDAGTVTVSYPTNRSKGNYQGFATAGHQLLVNGGSLPFPTKFGLTFNANASGITLTNRSGLTWPQGTRLSLQLDRFGANNTGDLPANPTKVVCGKTFLIDLGSPAAAAANNICTSQAITALAGGTVNGALATSGVATLDVPRNVVAAWTGTAVVTVTGKDEYGVTIHESSASGTSFTGKKAFKTVTAVTTSADITGATVGTGTVLGLPVVLPNVASVLKELQDGAVATAGTVVAAVRTLATATTGDVRGTYTPNAAPDADKGYQLIAFLADTSDKGVAQF